MPCPLCSTNGGPGSRARGASPGPSRPPGRSWPVYPRRGAGRPLGPAPKAAPAAHRHQPSAPEETRPVSAPSRGSTRRGCCCCGGRAAPAPAEAAPLPRGPGRTAPLRAAGLPALPAPYQVVVLLIIAHEIILHVRHLGRRTGGGRGRGPGQGGGSGDGPFSHNPARRCPMWLRAARNPLPPAPLPPPGRGTRSPNRAAPPPASSPC